MYSLGVLFINMVFGTQLLLTDGAPISLLKDQHLWREHESVAAQDFAKQLLGFV